MKNAKEEFVDRDLHNKEVEMEMDIILPGESFETKIPAREKFLDTREINLGFKKSEDKFTKDTHNYFSKIGDCCYGGFSKFFSVDSNKADTEAQDIVNELKNLVRASFNDALDNTYILSEKGIIYLLIKQKEKGSPEVYLFDYNYKYFDGTKVLDCSVENIVADMVKKTKNMIISFYSRDEE